METRAAQDHVERTLDLAEQPAETGTTVSRAREAMNLRLLLELRRRLKAAAERELATGSDRMRRFREEIQRATNRLRLTLLGLRRSADELNQLAQRMGEAHGRAGEIRARLSALEHEHADLAGQLDGARVSARELQDSVRSSRHLRHGTLDSLVVAATALANDLEHASRDQQRLRARGNDLMGEGDMLSARATTLHECLRSTGDEIVRVCVDVETALDGAAEARHSEGAPDSPADPGDGESER